MNGRLGSLGAQLGAFVLGSIRKVGDYFHLFEPLGGVQPVHRATGTELHQRSYGYTFPAVSSAVQPVSATSGRLVSEKTTAVIDNYRTSGTLIWPEAL